MEFIDGIAFKWTNEKNKKGIYMGIRLSKDLVKRIDEFIEKLELNLLPIQGKGYKSLAIRLLIEDSLTRYMGPKLNPDDLTSPYADEMSAIIPILRNIRLREKLENVTGDQEEINKIIKKFG